MTGCFLLFLLAEHLIHYSNGVQKRAGKEMKGLSLQSDSAPSEGQHSWTHVCLVITQWRAASNLFQVIGRMPRYYNLKGHNISSENNILVYALLIETYFRMLQRRSTSICSFVQ